MEKKVHFAKKKNKIKKDLGMATSLIEKFLHPHQYLIIKVIGYASMMKKILTLEDSLVCSWGHHRSFSIIHKEPYKNPSVHHSVIYIEGDGKKFSFARNALKCLT